jgi:hypothetical protein
MDLAYIFESFKSLKSVPEKIEYIQGLRALNLPYEFNYENLIRAWESQVEVSEPETE